MIRILLTVILPIALPLLLYFAYAKYARPRPGPDDTAAPARHADVAFWIALGVAAAALAGMVALGMSRGVPPGTKLISPRLENGSIVPSQRLDREP